MSYSRVNLFFRSLFVFIAASLIVFVYSFICIAARVLPLRHRHAFIRSYLRAHIYLLKVVCYIDYKIEGLENIPTDRAGIILSKHQSTWETFFLPLLFPNVAIILKRELLWIPFFGWGLATLEPIAINRKSQGSAMQQIIKQGEKCLNEGRSILIFPEGTRIPPGKAGHYKIGGARLAAATGYPVIPVAHNAGYFWKKGQFIKTPGTIRMIIGPVIESKGRTPEEILRLAKEWIEATAANISQDFHQ